MCQFTPHRAFSVLLLMFGQALTRDGFRRVLTGAFNETSFERNVELRISGSLGGLVIEVQTSHILDGSLVV